MATTYKPLASDLGLAAGLLAWDLTDERFGDALQILSRQISLDFGLKPLEDKHPNAMIIEAFKKGTPVLTVHAAATGGGGFLISKIESFDVSIDGKSHNLLIRVNASNADELAKLAGGSNRSVEMIQQNTNTDRMIQIRSPLPFSAQDMKDLEHPLSTGGFHIPALYFPRCGDPLFESTEAMLNMAAGKKSLGETALAYESTILGLSTKDVAAEMGRRYDIMKQSVLDGLEDNNVKMMLLDPSAGGILEKEATKQLPTGGIHTRAGAMAMAAMHTCNSLGVVCAAPTGGSAGVLPGLLSALAETNRYSSEDLLNALFAASAIGLMIIMRATFAAEIAGCQVEIGAAGAMGAAAVVDLAGGTPEQAVNAAAICLQNTMGSVCDPVQGTCEIPCHTRNAAAASSALLAADMILGGYRNPIPLDETIDAVLETGKSLPSTLRCTAKGGIAAAPSAVQLKNRRHS
jgi:L-serine dehydratase